MTPFRKLRGDAANPRTPNHKWIDGCCVHCGITRGYVGVPGYSRWKYSTGGFNRPACIKRDATHS